MPDQNRINRRMALKAGTAAGVSAATWSAPKLESLRLVPDYAAAFTASPIADCAGWSNFFEVENAGGSPSPVPRFEDPVGIAVDSAYNVWVADHTKKTVYGFRSDGSQFQTLQNFEWPIDVAIGPTDHVFVADDGYGPTPAVPAVYKYTSFGALDLTIDNSTNAPNPPFIGPAGVAVDSAGNIHVVDPWVGVVYRFDSSGTQTRTLVGSDASPAIGRPDAVAADAAGNVYVLDRVLDRVWGFRPDDTQFFTQTVSFISSRIGVDAAGTLLVVPDFGSNRLFGISIPDGATSPIGIRGWGAVAGVAIDALNRVYFVDQIQLGAYGFGCN